MKKVAITGNIGSGKSYVSEVLRKMGFPVYEADREAGKFLMHPDVIMKITDRFGLEVLTPDGLPDRKKLAAIVFNDPDALQWLNHTIHPMVMSDWAGWIERQEATDAVFLESAIIFENNLQHHFDMVVMVDAPVEITIERVMLRDNVSREEVLIRMKHQWNVEQKQILSDFIILNDDQVLLLPQIVMMLGALWQKPL
jgi:dephospho-CoA kinase